MKKILWGFLFTFFYLPTYPISYKELRQAFRDRLYECQIRLMQDKNKYYEFIEPYIKEAEKNLIIIRYCIDNSDFVNTSEESNIPLLLSYYFNCLVAYNCSFFNYYVNPDAVRTSWLEDSAENLMDAIKAFKEQGNIAYLNVKQEYNKTINLFQKANKAYYKELPFTSKTTIYLFRPIGDFIMRRVYYK